VAGGVVGRLVAWAVAVSLWLVGFGEWPASAPEQPALPALATFTVAGLPVLAAPRMSR
jgi:hypothetical protein